MPLDWTASIPEPSRKSRIRLAIESGNRAWRFPSPDHHGAGKVAANYVGLMRQHFQDRGEAGVAIPAQFVRALFRDIAEVWQKSWQR
ncbi:hypothetical protein [Rhizobium sp. S9]|uniref:hypothetical protein n=1 Tax=Rhizobium sp. S9 TaxID=2035454 RepID=UPI000A20F5A3|nr:hypothetical protein [Rhizobium sp. S9]ARO25960.1 hypothetical protein TAL182_CH04260 [Rhizobium sp. TAL182]